MKVIKKDKKWLIIGLPALLIVIVAGILFAVLFGKKSNNDAGSNAANQTNSEMDVADSSNDSNIADSGNSNSNNTNSNNSNGITSHGTGTNNTGNLTEKGNGYEGIKGTGKYNYGEALQKSLLFYELQRSGDLPDETRCNWRGDSCLKDGSDAGLDLTGGWYDAGDNVKFNLPMAYSAMMLGWSIYEDKEAYEESGQLEYALGNIKWANDYFIKCHPSDEVYYYQVGNGGSDHSFWGAAEVVEYRMDRPSYCVTKDNPGSTVCGEAAASLAVCSIVFKDIDPDYSALCLKHAKSLYKFAEDTKSDSGYTMAAGFYDSWSGFYDELSLAATWLYLATDDDSYLQKAKEYYPQAGQDYAWALCWDDVHIGAALLLARLTGDNVYTNMVEKHLDWWTTGTSDGERINYTPKGLAWLDSWGSLRYATTTSYVAALYSEWEGCPSNKKDTYWDFAESQVEYALGSTGFSYEIGFGDEYPVRPHHRTAQGSYCDNMNEPSSHRHTLYGALVGGPDGSDGYTDEVSNYNTNEVACDYNAGFTGILAKLYGKYHGETLKDFGAVEEINVDEILVQGAVNVSGDDFVEIKAYVLNESAWPARSPEELEMRYYVDLSEVYNAGGTADDIEISTNYMQAGSANGLVCQDEDNHIYYLSVVFNEGDIYPGGQSQYKAEIQVRMRYPGGPWDDSNDPSFACLNGNSVVDAYAFALFEKGNLIYGEEPAKGAGSGNTVKNSNNAGNNSNSNNADNNNNNSNNNSASNSVKNGSSANDNVEVKMEYSSTGASASSISGTLTVTNKGNDISLKDLAIDYYLTNDDSKGLVFSCYHSAINGNNGSYTGVNGCKGDFSNASGNDADTKCTMSFTDGVTLSGGDSLTVNFCINNSDWSNMNTTNDHSAKQVDNIVIKASGKKIFGNEP